MSTEVVAGHDIRRTLRSRVFVGLVGASIVVCVAGLLVGQLVGTGRDPVSALRVQLLGMWMVAGTVVGFIGVSVGASGIAGERQNRTLRLLASLPIRRSELLYGKVLSRVTVVVVSVCAGLVVSLSALVVGTPVPAMGQVTGFAVFTVAVAVCYVTVGVAVSTLVTASRVRAVAVVVFTVTVVWPRAFSFGVEIFGSGPISSALKFLATLTPFGAYSQVVSDEAAILAFEVDSALLGSGTMAAVLFAWTVLSLVVARRGIERRDI
ncbi:ABC transporter permease subunit [Halobaculum sp. MBLA0143]|uniref:ABC transporter permease subunit n=1 Tax=Halobaculum sp. MBLA0143 TaxID=3079933 RepID=UPI00352655E9